mmetsp:Transcript_6624/g.21942  ORF Transcript_6624/g.21942 Transcript_6624/m.21942 type:complete len:251 (+) Transcript_6624:234-986(+)
MLRLARSEPSLSCSAILRKPVGTARPPSKVLFSARSSSSRTFRMSSWSRWRSSSPGSSTTDQRSSTCCVSSPGPQSACCPTPSRIVAASRERFSHSSTSCCSSTALSSASLRAAASASRSAASSLIARLLAASCRSISASAPPPPTSSHASSLPTTAVVITLAPPGSCMHPHRDDDERTNLSHGSNSPARSVRRNATRCSDGAIDSRLTTANWSTGGSTEDQPACSGPRALKRTLKPRLTPRAELESVAT